MIITELLPRVRAFFVLLVSILCFGRESGACMDSMEAKIGEQDVGLGLQAGLNLCIL